MLQLSSNKYHAGFVLQKFSSSFTVDLQTLPMIPESNFAIANDQNIKLTNMTANPLFSISNCLSFTFSTSDLQVIKFR
jgi:hypothetical protein